MSQVLYQVLSRPFIDTQVVDGLINDRPLTLSGMDRKMLDITIINTLIYDQPFVRENASASIILPIA